MPLKRVDGALSVVDFESDTVVVAEVELSKVAVQVLLAAVLIDALHAALEDREVALDGARVNVATDVLTLAVLKMPCSANSRPTLM